MLRRLKYARPAAAFALIWSSVCATEAIAAKGTYRRRQKAFE